MPRGRPFQSGNNLGRGRPKGSRNRKTLLAEELLDSHAEAVVSQALAPRKGDAQVLRILLGHILPREIYRTISIISDLRTLSLCMRVSVCCNVALGEPK